MSEIAMFQTPKSAVSCNGFRHCWKAVNIVGSSKMFTLERKCNCLLQNNTTLARNGLLCEWFCTAKANTGATFTYSGFHSCKCKWQKPRSQATIGSLCSFGRALPSAAQRELSVAICLLYTSAHPAQTHISPFKLGTQQHFRYHTGTPFSLYFLCCSS